MIGVGIDSRNIIAWRIPNDPSPKQRKARSKPSTVTDEGGKKMNKSGKFTCFLTCFLTCLLTRLLTRLLTHSLIHL